MAKHVVEIMDINGIRKTIELSNSATGQAPEQSRNVQTEEYKVMGMDETRQINPQFQMFSMDEFRLPATGESSRKTSASTALHEQVIQGGSLATILSQCLVSEDKD